jgi:hypothetical protein
MQIEIELPFETDGPVSENLSENFGVIRRLKLLLGEPFLLMCSGNRNTFWSRIKARYNPHCEKDPNLRVGKCSVEHAER